MSLLDKDYYTIEEAINKIQTYNIKFNEKDLYYYGERNKLQFSLYVGSRPAFAAKCDQVTRKNLRFIAYCNVHGVFPLIQSDLCQIVANDNAVIDFLAGNVSAVGVVNLVISNWTTTLPPDVQKAGLDYANIWHPEGFNKQLIIDFFYLKPDYVLQLHSGQFLPFNVLTDKLAKEAATFELGVPRQWPKNQLFTKSDLRITKSNLESFISTIIQSITDREVTQGIEETKDITSRRPIIETKYTSIKQSMERYELNFQQIAYEVNQDFLNLYGYIGDINKKVYRKKKQMDIYPDLLSKMSEQERIEFINQKGEEVTHDGYVLIPTKPHKSISDDKVQDMTPYIGHKNYSVDLLLKELSAGKKMHLWLIGNSENSHFSYLDNGGKDIGLNDIFILNEELKHLLAINANTAENNCIGKIQSNNSKSISNSQSIEADNTYPPASIQNENKPNKRKSTTNADLINGLKQIKADMNRDGKDFTLHNLVDFILDTTSKSELGNNIDEDDSLKITGFDNYYISIETPKGTKRSDRRGKLYWTDRDGKRKSKSLRSLERIIPKC